MYVCQCVVLIRGQRYDLLHNLGQQALHSECPRIGGECRRAQQLRRKPTSHLTKQRSKQWARAILACLTPSELNFKDLVVKPLKRSNQ